MNAMLGAIHYEFKMQLRRPALWFAIGITGFLILAGIILPSRLESGTNMLRLVANKTSTVNFFLLIVAGILLADRLPRERRLKLTELHNTLPTSIGVRMWGKYLGATLATAIPVALVCALVIFYYAMLTRDANLLALEVPAFATIVLPGLLFVGAFSIVCPAIIPVPLYSLFLLGYWVWGNLIPPRMMPTLNCTLLLPSGGYVESGLFNGGTVCERPAITATPLQAWESIVLLLLVAALAMFAGQIYLNWRAGNLFAHEGATG